MYTKLAGLGLLLLAFGGYIAGIPVVSAAVPIGPIAVGAVITAVAVVVRLFQRPDTRAILPLAVLGLAFLPGVILAPIGIGYADDKVAQLLSIVPLTIIGAALCIQDRRALRVVQLGTVAVGVLVGVVSFVYADAALVGSGRYAAEGSNTIAAGRAAAGGFVVAVLMGLTAKRWLYAGPAAVFLAVAAVVSGSRGPILAAGIALAVALVVSRLKFPAIATFGLVALGLVGYRFALANEVIPERLLSFDDGSAQARSSLLDATIDIAASNVGGIGWGGLALEYTGFPGLSANNFRYPHNIYIEAAAEGGLVAFLALVGVLLLAVRMSVRASGDWLETSALALLIFFSVNAFVSGDLISNRGFWLYLGVCLAAGARGRSAVQRSAEDSSE
ncbi:O-antigen ligase family protein [Dietzia sp. SL131]|uniref:O-antigen ligase family protein n=1 Tax=Dietzia sp. SL131 TaxID=2995149 RepID=UPI00227C59EF|nr:O-antigen ligase family protein [Dietzia sp. SL131]MCY1657975.1 O-antigen ligase family protein [Dietzia sp. SL131]